MSDLMKKFIVWSTILTSIGILIGANWSYQYTQKFLSTAVKAQGKVVDLLNSSSDGDTVYAPIITFKDRKGVEHQIISSVYSDPPRYAVGAIVPMVYDPKDPSHAEVYDSFDLYFEAGALAVVGMIPLIVGGGILVFLYRRQRRELWLRENGMSVAAKVTSVALNMRLTVNGRHPYIIYAQWQDPASQITYQFRSKNLWYDPRQYVKETIEVMIDPSDPKKYMMSEKTLRQD